MKADCVSPMQLDMLFSQGVISLIQHNTLCTLAVCAGWYSTDVEISTSIRILLRADTRACRS